MSLLHLTVGLAFWQLLALVLLGTCLDTPGMTARQSLVPEPVERARMPVERATSVLQAIEGSSDLLDPPHEANFVEETPSRHSGA
jgi:hypothetical protein